MSDLRFLLAEKPATRFRQTFAQPSESEVFVLESFLADARSWIDADGVLPLRHSPPFAVPIEETFAVRGPASVVYLAGRYERGAVLNPDPAAESPAPSPAAREIVARSLGGFSPGWISVDVNPHGIEVYRHPLADSGFTFVVTGVAAGTVGVDLGIFPFSDERVIHFPLRTMDQGAHLGAFPIVEAFALRNTTKRTARVLLHGYFDRDVVDLAEPIP